MYEQSVATTLAPDVFIDEVLGELQVKGWDEAEVVVKGAQDELSLSEQDDVVHLSCRGNCAVRLPSGATLRVGTVLGEARFKLLEDQLTVDSVQGSLLLRDVAETRIGEVNGELYARDVSGSLSAEVVRGNANLRDVQGDCTIQQVMGNAEIRDVESALNITAYGNAWVRLSEFKGEEYRIEAHGNAQVNIPEEAGVRLDLYSGGHAIRLKLSEGSKEVNEPHLETTLGSGAIPMLVRASGNLVVIARESSEAEGETGRGEYYSTFEEDLTRQIEAQVEAMTRQINEQLNQLTQQMGKTGLSPEETEEIMRRARTSSEKAQARAVEHMRLAQEKLERKMEAARRRSEKRAEQSERRGRHTWKFEFNSPPPPPPPPHEPVVDEERLMILRMLEQKKISLEEAESLLAALEGRD